MYYALTQEFNKEAIIGLTYLTTFWFFLPKIYIKSVLIPHKNNIIKRGPLYSGGFLWVFVLWILSTSHPGYNRRGFFGEFKWYFEEAPTQLNVFMARKLLENIISTILFNDTLLPSFKYKLFQKIDNFWMEWSH